MWYIPLHQGEIVKIALYALKSKDVFYKPSKPLCIMKKHLNIFVILLIGITACEKDMVSGIEPVPEIVIESPDTVSIKTGRYSGEMWMYLPDRDTICMSGYREVYRDDKGYLVMRWWSFPDTTTRIKNTDTLKYRMVYDNTNTSCGIQRSVYYYHARSYMAGDTLIESGTVEHRYYYEGRMVKRLFGDWRSEARYVDRLTPMKPR